MNDQPDLLAAAEVAPKLSDAELEEILNATHGRAVRDAIDVRIEQIRKHGHSRDADADRPPWWLVRDAHQRLQRGFDLINCDPDRRDLGRARSTILKGIAVALAAIDRLDLETKAEKLP